MNYTFLCLSCFFSLFLGSCCKYLKKTTLQYSVVYNIKRYQIQRPVNISNKSQWSARAHPHSHLGFHIQHFPTVHLHTIWNIEHSHDRYFVIYFKAYMLPEHTNSHTALSLATCIPCFYDLILRSQQLFKGGSLVNPILQRRKLSPWRLTNTTLHPSVWTHFRVPQHFLDVLACI